jgi:hypothetical protein
MLKGSSELQALTAITSTYSDENTVSSFPPRLCADHNPEEGRVVVLSDEAFLRLLAEMQVKHCGTIEEARTIYETAAKPGGPSKLEDRQWQNGCARSAAGVLSRSI